MTEAGWTRNKPTEAGWYWRKFLYCHVEHVEVCRVQKFGEIGGELGVWERGAVKDLTGEWLGPITPTDRQQGKVAGLREASRKASDAVPLLLGTHPSFANVIADALMDFSDILSEDATKLAQQAQGEKVVE